MSIGRDAHTVTLLPNGKLLVAGGSSNGTDSLSSAELYDPSAGGWTAANVMSFARVEHTATSLPDGKILVAGGFDSSGYLPAAEVYDPTAGTWATTGVMHSARGYHTATLLANGKVLVAGGLSGGGDLSAAEIYDPGTGAWATTGPMTQARHYHTATLLPNGKILVAGGDGGGFTLGELARSPSNAELYDPATGIWTATQRMNYPHEQHTATLLPNGKVLVAGGTIGYGGSCTGDSELYDPAAGTWTMTHPMNDARWDHTATLLPNGKVLAAGGQVCGGMPSSFTSADIYDPATGNWTATGAMSGNRSQHTATLLPNGKVLAVGGAFGPNALSTVEIYDPAAGRWTPANTMSTTRYDHTATLLPNGKVLVAGGRDSAGTRLSVGELISYTEYDVQTATAVRPVIAQINGSSVFPAMLHAGTAYTLTGSTFTGLSGGSSGNTEDSAANLPRVRLQRLDSSIDISTSIYDVYGGSELATFQSGQSSTKMMVSVPSGLACGYYNLVAQSNAVSSTFTAVLVAPGAPVSGPGVSGTPVVSASYHSITVQWTTDGSDTLVSGYVLRTCQDAGCGAVVSTGFTTTPGALTMSVPALSSNTAYFFQAAAENCGGMGPFTPGIASALTLGAPPAGCSMAVNVSQDGTADTTTIQGAVNSLPPNLAGNECVVIRDTQTYAEQIMIQGFTNNGFQVKIMADPSFVSSAPVVNPPVASTAAFVIANSSVSVFGINIIPTNSTTYGVLVSSTYVQLSSVNVLDAGGKISAAGVVASSWTMVTGSSITVANAHGLEVFGNNASVSYSSMANNSLSSYAVFLNASSSGTYTGIYANNSYVLAAGPANTYTVVLASATGNTVSSSTFTAPGGVGVTLLLIDSSSNTLTQDVVQNNLQNTNTGEAAQLTASSLNTLSYDIITNNSALGGTFDLTNASSSNTITHDFISNQYVNGDGALGILGPGNSYNTVSFSTLTVNSNFPSTSAGLWINSGYNTIVKDYISNPSGYAVQIALQYGSLSAAGNSIRLSSITSNTASYPAVAVQAGVSSTTIIQCFISNPSGNAVVLQQSSATSILSDYIQGSTAVYVSGSTATVIGGSVLVMASAMGSGLYLGQGSNGLFVTTTNIIGGSQGNGVFFDASNTGAQIFNSDTVSGARYGLLINNQAAAASLSIASMTFTGLTPGATGISFLGGNFVSTFSNVNFADTNIAVNVNGVGLGVGGRITMVMPTGPRSGDAFDNDPASRVDWPFAISNPSQPGTPAGTVLGVSSIAWTWAAAANAASYIVYQTTSPMTEVGLTNGLILAQTGLSPDTAASVFVQASNLSGTGGASSSGASLYTLANPPSGLTSSAVQATSATLTWSLNGNPVGITAEVERSTDSIAFGKIFSGGATTMADYGLLACTRYYYRTRNRNGNSIVTDYSGTINLTTKGSMPSAPSNLTAEPLEGNRISLSWIASPSVDATQYRLYEVGTGTGSYGSSVAVFTSTETSYTTGILSAGFHGFALRTVNRCGVEESSGTYASANSITAVSSVRTGIKSPGAGKRIRGNSVTIIAELTAGNPVDVSSVTFQIKPAAGTAWADVPAANGNHSNPSLASPYFIQWDADSYGSANGFGLYDIRAVAMNVAFSSDTAPSSIRITLVNKNTSIVAGDDYDIKEDGGSKDQVVNNAVANTIAAAGAGANDPAVKIFVPAGAFSGSMVTATVVVNPVISAAPPRGFSMVGSALQIDLSNLQSSLNVPATVTLSYPESADGDADMQIQSYNPRTGAWSAIGASTRDKTLRTVTAPTPHFSIFAIVAGAGPQADLSGARVYPVPFKPNGSNPNEGKPYSAGDAASGIIFDKLPAVVKIKIYTLSGRLVAQLDTSAGTGTIQWDSKNESGLDVASGGYFAVISSPGSQSVVKRLLVIR